MLKELRIENLVLIEKAELRLGAGLNAITGETGAGKTVLAHAIDLLLGGKARKGAVRPGAEEAWVEGIFELPEGLLEGDRFADLRERLPDSPGREISLARRVSADGRTRAFIEGRSATAGDLAALGGELVTFLGQHEHRKLTLGSAQQALLDEFAGTAHAVSTDQAGSSNQAESINQSGSPSQSGLLPEARAVHTQLRAATARLGELEELEGRRERELGLIEFELDEIEQLEPSVEDENDLRTERDRLRAVDLLREGAFGALESLDGDDPGGATALLAAAQQRLEPAAAADASLDTVVSRLANVLEELSELARELRGYGDALAADPERLQAVEERLDSYDRLIRKHGGTVAAVIAHGERCREQRDALGGADAKLAALREEMAALSERQQVVCAKLTAVRRKAAPRLAKAVTAELAELALPDAVFTAHLEARPDGPGADGADRIEFLVALNPGMPATPLRETASGGELSRIMLALLTAVQAREGGTFVFDEVDAGIGGRTARAVGERLRDLGARHQVLCITHLPQVAAMAQTHFQIVKRSVAGGTLTEVRPLVADEIIEEVRRMLGGEDGDEAALDHARELLTNA